MSNESIVYLKVNEEYSAYLQKMLTYGQLEILSQIKEISLVGDVFDYITHNASKGKFKTWVVNSNNLLLDIAEFIKAKNISDFTNDTLASHIFSEFSF